MRMNRRSVASSDAGVDVSRTTAAMFHDLMQEGTDPHHAREGDAESDVPRYDVAQVLHARNGFPISDGETPAGAPLACMNPKEGDATTERSEHTEEETD